MFSVIAVEARAMRIRFTMRPFAVLFAMLTLALLASQAQTVDNWNGGNGDWNTAGDWSTGVVPNNGGGKTYNVTISNGEAETVTLNLGVTISDLTLGASATLQSSGSDSLTIASGGTFTNSGTLEFNTGANVLTMASGSTLNNESGATLQFSGSGSGLKITGTTNNDSDATITLEGGSTSTFTGSVNNSGTFQTGFSGGNNTVTVTGTFTNAAGATLELEGSGDVVNVNALSNAGMLTIDSGATLNITGGGQGVTDVVANSTIELNGDFNVINSGKSTSAIGNLTTVAGTLDVNNGLTNTITPSGGTLTIASGGSINLSDPTASITTLSITGSVNNSGNVTTGFSGGTNTVNVSGTFTNAAGAETILYGTNDTLNVNALSNSGDLEIGNGVGSGATLNITGGGQGVTDIVAGSTIEDFGNFNVINSGKSTWALANLTTVAGTLELNNNQSNTITPGGGTLTVASGGSLDLSDPSATTTSLAITGSVSNSGNFTTGFSGGTNTVNVSGTFTNVAGGELILYGTNDTVNVNALSNSGYLSIGNGVGSGATLNITGGGQGVTDVVAGSTINDFGMFNVINSGKSTWALGNLTTVAGTLELNNDQSNSMTPGGGTLTIANGGEIELSDGVATTTSLSITGSVSNSGTFATGFSGGTNTVNVSGTFTNAAGGDLTLYGSGDTVNIPTLSNAGTVQIGSDNSTPVLNITGTGTLTNSGNFDLEGGTLHFSSSTASLTGGGTVYLNFGGNTGSAITVGSSDTGTLTNVNNTIYGVGNFGNGTLNIVNQGTIDVNGSLVTGVVNTLTIQPGSSGLTNTGTLEASDPGSNGATLILEGTINNTKGTIQAAGQSGATATATVELASGAVINGGTLSTTTSGTNAGVLENTGAVTLNGVTISGTYTDTTDGTTTLEGTITNNGSIAMSGSTLSIGNSVTLAGTKGTVVLSNSASNLITAATSGLTLTNDNTIEGAGTIENMGIVNDGTISADQSTALIILPSSAGLTNKGTLSVSTGDTMEIGTSAGGALVNFSGTTLTGGIYKVSGILEFGASGTSLVTNDANITLTGSKAEIEDFAGQNILTDFATNAGGGSFSLAGGADFVTAGNFTNNGSLTAGAGSVFKVSGSLTNFSSSTDTLTGGSYTVGGKLEFAGADIVTDAASITMTGTGEILNTTNNSNGLTNLATITSAGTFVLTGKADFTTAGNLTADGTLSLASGSTLTVTGNLTNLSGGTLASGTYSVGGTLQLTSGNGSITTNAANLTVTGTAGKILDGTSNALSTLVNNTGSFTLSGGASLTTPVSTNFTNSGTVDVGTSSTLDVGDAYVQSKGTTTVDGTLTTGSDSGITVSSGTVYGAGTLNANVSNSATVNAGDSGKAGLLGITGSYTQLSSGTLNVSIGGTTLGTQYSQLKISGPASLGGTLTATLINKFTPTIGQTFTILTASSVTGTFTNSTIAINSSEQFDISYTSDSVVLTVVSTTPSNSNKTQTANEVASADPKHAVGWGTFVGAKNTLRHAIGMGVNQGVQASAIDVASGKAGLSDIRPGVPRVWEQVPVAPSWDHVKAVTVGETPHVATMQPDPVQHVDNWVGRSHAVPVQAPLAGWSGVRDAHRVPMRILPPMLPTIR
jgi:fibronectin-binding autotransporter adhesin